MAEASSAYQLLEEHKENEKERKEKEKRKQKGLAVISERANFPRKSQLLSYAPKCVVGTVLAIRGSEELNVFNWTYYHHE